MACQACPLSAGALRLSLDSRNAAKGKQGKRHKETHLPASFPPFKGNFIGKQIDRGANERVFRLDAGKRDGSNVCSFVRQGC